MTVDVLIRTGERTHNVLVGKPALDKIRCQFNPNSDHEIETAKLVSATFVQLCINMSIGRTLGGTIQQEIQEAVGLMQSAQMKLVCAIARIRDDELDVK
jgi:hypothetical protein